MKALLILFLFLNTASAYECGNAEAQIIAKVVNVETDSLTFCKAYVSEDSISFFNESTLCPLSKGDVIKKGINFPLINGHDCEVHVGQRITGVLSDDGLRINLD